MESTTKVTHPIPSDPFHESVYALIPEEIPPSPKQERYRSKFAQQARVEYNQNRKTTASMGPAKVAVNHPTDFLKKNARESISPKKETFHSDKTIRKAPVPKDLGIIPAKTSKDFITLNALENINSNAKKRSQGAPSYLTKKDYGRTPDYLVKKMDAALEEKKAREEEALKAEAAAKVYRNGLVQLPEDERLRILDGLKSNWEKLNSDYQKLSLTVDTVPKIARKVNMEQQLKHLEDHIQKFSHTNVYVDFQSAYAS